MNPEDKNFNFPLKNNSKDYDFDEPSWNNDVDIENIKKTIKNELPDYDFDESSWRTELQK